MTREQWKERLPLIQAFVDGKRLQIYQNQSQEWIDLTSSPTFSDPVICYRIRPEPKLRPWKMDEVPVGALVKGKTTGSVWMLCGASADGNYYVSSSDQPFSPELLFHNYEWRYHHETEWKPCGVKEEA